MIGLIVVGKPAAAVMTSSPALSRDSPCSCDVSDAIATRFALEPEFTRTHSRTPYQRANSRSKRSAKRPVVSQKSSALSTSDTMSRSSKTRPDTGAASSPGTNVRCPYAAAKYSRVFARTAARKAFASGEELLSNSIRESDPVLAQQSAVPRYRVAEAGFERPLRRPTENDPRL